MKNNKGFTLVEALTSVSIVFTLLIITIPINTILKTERVKLYDERAIGFYLHDELLNKLYTNDFMETDKYTVSVNNRHVQLQFTRNGDLLKGCARWENVKQQNKQYCLYGYKKQ